jgi:hypothetical protein
MSKRRPKERETASAKFKHPNFKLVEFHHFKNKRKKALFVSLTNPAKAIFPGKKRYRLIKNGRANRKTIDFIGFLKKLDSPDFKPMEFHGFKNKVTRNRVKSASINQESIR